MSDFYHYVKIGTTSDGYAIVEVCFESVLEATNAYDATIKALEKKYPIAKAGCRIEVDNDNKDRMPVVSVKGDEQFKPTEKFIQEREKAEH